jgi:CDP-glucose 4,6-dehydratase
MRTNQSNKKVNQIKTTKTMVKRTSTKVKDFTVGFTNEIYKVIQVGRTFAMLTTNNQPVTKLAGVSKQKMKQAMDENKAIQAYVSKAGKISYKLVEMDEFKKHSATISDEACDSVSEAFETHDALKEFIHTKGKDLKPTGLFIEELKWKYLLRSAVRGKNILMTGPTGCGKTLAAQSLVRYSYQHAAETYQTNVMGTVNLLEAIRSCETSTKVVINITTDKCYKNNNWAWGYREIDLLGGSDPYSYSKSCSEFVAKAYRESFFERRDIRIASARAGNVIGGGDWSDDRLIPDIILMLFGDKNLVIRNPDSTRPWQHVLEPILGYMVLAKQLYEYKSDLIQNYSSFNFGPKQDESMSVQEIIRRVIEIHGEEVCFKIEQGQIGVKKEEKLLMLDSTKAKDLLHWESRIQLSQALEWTYDWYKTFYDGKSVREFTFDQIKRYEQLAL